MFVSDYMNNRVRVVTPSREVHTLVGDGVYLATDGRIDEVQTCGPLGVAADSWDDVYFTDQVR